MHNTMHNIILNAALPLYWLALCMRECPIRRLSKLYWLITIFGE